MKTLKDIETNLTEKEKKELAEIVKRIKATCQIRMIILFGSHARGEQVDDSQYSEGKKSDYDILVIPLSCTKKLQKKVKLLLKNLFHDIIDKTVSCLVVPIDKLNSLLHEGQYFYTEIKNEGIYLYKTGSVELEDAVILSPQREREIAEEYFELWFGQSKEFYKTANYQIKEDMIRMSAFNLQQCAESCYKCVELVLTRYCPKEHLLTELKERVVKLNSEFEIPFPCETPEQIVLFNHLDFAYTGARYNKDYTVTYEQLEYWKNENENLMNITNEICTSHIEKLREKENDSKEN